MIVVVSVSGFLSVLPAKTCMSSQYTVYHNIIYENLSHPIFFESSSPSHILSHLFNRTSKKAALFDQVGESPYQNINAVTGAGLLQRGLTPLCTPRIVGGVWPSEVVS